MSAAVFVSWWLNELRELGESALARVAPKLVTRAVIRIAPSRGSISVVRGSDEQHVLDLPGLDDAKLSEQITLGELREKLQGMRATLVLSADQVLAEELTFPRAVERELDRVLAIHIERHAPLQSTLAYVAHRVVARDRATKRITVVLLLAHARMVDRVRELATSWGVRVVRIGTEGPGGTVVGNFLARDAQGAQLLFTKLDRWLAASAAVLTGVLLCAIGGQWIYERAQVGREVRAATAAAGEAQELRRQIEQHAAPAVALASIMARPDALQILASLSERVPDDSWTYELEIRTPPGQIPELDMSGLTSAAGQLVDLLEQAPEFTQVRLESTTTAELLGSSQERVQVTAKVASQ